MKSLENLIYVLSQLKANPVKYNLTNDDIQKIDQAIEEIKELQERLGIVDKIEQAVSIGANLVAILEKVLDILDLDFW